MQIWCAHVYYLFFWNSCHFTYKKTFFELQVLLDLFLLENDLHTDCSKAKEGRKRQLWGFGLTWTGKDLLDDRKQSRRRWYDWSYLWVHSPPGLFSQSAALPDPDLLMEDVKEEETVQRQPNASHSAPSCSANPRHRYKDAPDPKEGAALFFVSCGCRWG